MTRRTTWEYVDSEGVRWHEFPESAVSRFIVLWSMCEEQLADPEMGSSDAADACPALLRDEPGAIDMDDSCVRVDAMLAIATRAAEWVAAGGKRPKGTRMARKAKR